ncbi:hypothetical protein BJ508DRAFT_345963 [Ascobolus immersus RN42]|uniref:Uncharacterized protein n=1 Tax=Ascobolus immersus RN42 TaxID=1160509 RepID=A0A3N4H892_ASCIM|nr:hypothetical protein BJ508DRAFT_345963 [Ascobolus immersus RN42]
MGFESLPVELIQLIGDGIHDWVDFQALRRASPACLHALADQILWKPHKQFSLSRQVGFIHGEVYQFLLQNAGIRIRIPADSQPGAEWRNFVHQNNVSRFLKTLKLWRRIAVVAEARKYPAQWAAVSRSYETVKMHMSWIIQRYTLRENRRFQDWEVERSALKEVIELCCKNLHLQLYVYENMSHLHRNTEERYAFWGELWLGFLGSVFKELDDDLAMIDLNSTSTIDVLSWHLDRLIRCTIDHRRHILHETKVNVHCLRLNSRSVECDGKNITTTIKTTVPLPAQYSTRVDHHGLSLSFPVTRSFGLALAAILKLVLPAQLSHPLLL